MPYTASFLLMNSFSISVSTMVSTTVATSELRHGCDTRANAINVSYFSAYAFSHRLVQFSWLSLLWLPCFQQISSYRLFQRLLAYNCLCLVAFSSPADAVVQSHLMFAQPITNQNQFCAHRD